MPEWRAPAPALLALACAAFLYTTLNSLLLGFVCGCTACYAAVSSRLLHSYARRFEAYLCSNGAEQNTLCNAQQHGCAACGDEACARHAPEPGAEPWAGLRLHKQLDQAIEELYNAIIENFVSTWYSKITTQPFFLDELRLQLRYASAALLRRMYKINYSRLIIDKLVPCALHHHEMWVAAQRSVGAGASAAEAERAALAGALRGGAAAHPAAGSRADELRYLRCLTTAIMPYLLRQQEVQNRVFQVLIREIFAGRVLLSLTDVLADPYILNTLIILAVGDETMSTLPKTPDYRMTFSLTPVLSLFLPNIGVFRLPDTSCMVEFLENFVRQSECAYARRSRLLRVDLEALLGGRDSLYAFMQFMKTTGHFHLLQFCKDIKPFQMKILNPELTPNEEVALFNEAWDLYMRYFDMGSRGGSAVPFDPAVVEEMRAVLSQGAVSMKKLQTSKALYESSRYADTLLENVWIPRFLHSEEFYKLLYGPRVPTGYHKQMTKKPRDAPAPVPVPAAVRLGNKLKVALQPQTMDGQIVDCLTNSIEMEHELGVSEGGSMGSMDSLDIVRYLDGLSESRRLAEHDLSDCRVSVTRADTRQLVRRSGTIRVFTLSVERAGEGGATPWRVERTENDFHLLRGKLAEFHGEALLRGLALPSRRDNSPEETLRYKYEDFIQRLMQKSLLTTSELLHIFLSADGDFCGAVQQASLVGAAPDLAYMYQSVAHRLRKEKGQHLEPFVSAYLLSSDARRYQAAKQGASREVEEAEEVGDEVQFEMVGAAARRARDITQSKTFGNNFDLERRTRVERPPRACPDRLAGFSRCLMFLLLKVVRARGAVCGAVGGACSLLRSLADHWFNIALNRLLARLLSHRRLAHLIRLGHELLLVNKPAARQHAAGAHREHARALLLRAPPRPLRALLGAGLPAALDSAHAMLQSAKLNKQLLFSLLDLCAAELFPELVAGEGERSEAVRDYTL